MKVDFTFRLILRRKLLFLQALALIPLSIFASYPADRPVVLPLPESVAGVGTPVQLLNGTWKFTMTPPASFWQNAVDPSGWSDIEVPGEPWMQGFSIDFDVEYPYKQQINIPADFAGQRVFLRFGGGKVCRFLFLTVGWN